MTNELKACECGSEYYYIKKKITGILHEAKRFDGEEPSKLYEANDIFNDVEYLEKIISKYAYCGECDKKLFKL